MMNMIARYADYIIPIGILYIFHGIYKGFYGEKNWRSSIPNKTELWVLMVPFAVWYVLAYNFNITIGSTTNSEPHDEPTLVGIVSAGILFIQFLVNKYINRKVGFITVFFMLFTSFMYVFNADINNLHNKQFDFVSLIFITYLLYLFPLMLLQLLIFVLKFFCKRFQEFVLFNNSSDFLLTFLPFLFWFITADMNSSHKSLSNLVIEPFSVGIITSLFLVIQIFLSRHSSGKSVNYVTVVSTCVLAIVIGVFIPGLPE